MERIQVEVLFINGKLIPRWFMFNHERINIAKVNWSWRTREGEAIVVHFTITDCNRVFELCFNAITMEWFLMNHYEM